MQIIPAIKRSLFSWPPKPWVCGGALGILLFSFVRFSALFPHLPDWFLILSGFIAAFAGPTFFSLFICNQYGIINVYACYLVVAVSMVVFWSVLVTLLCTRKLFFIILATILFVASILLTVQNFKI
ncbi:MAG: hypothetical protein PHO20_04035 [Candidatus Peribacteraceae bacterium]|nr:hypothetical protein [Candidatus Peribacteraceae bacterium]MDD5739911.1 hypothetical protein [Candidatus Peribacteraceae bacterium]